MLVVDNVVFNNLRSTDVDISIRLKGVLCDRHMQEIRFLMTEIQKLRPKYFNNELLKFLLESRILDGDVRWESVVALYFTQQATKRVSYVSFFVLMCSPCFPRWPSAPVLVL